MVGDVIGLTVGSPVELRGVHVGKVRSINFSWAEYVETHAIQRSDDRSQHVRPTR